MLDVKLLGSIAKQMMSGSHVEVLGNTCQLILTPYRLSPGFDKSHSREHRPQPMGLGEATIFISCQSYGNSFPQSKQTT